ncbi:RICIN domain-containing protein [Kibdelosporangium aridum]|uniref:RICIN domain-containing protein n=1 Tax=Kibdelosporangium aridum TaxID=2030 RepID=UPI000691001D
MIFRRTRTLVTILAIAGLTGALTTPTPQQPGYTTVAYTADCDSVKHPERADYMTNAIRAAATGSQAAAPPFTIIAPSTGIAFYDRLTDTTCYFNPDRHFNTASIVKVLIAVAVEWQAQKEQRAVAADVADKIQTMITSTKDSTCYGTESNCAAVALWNMVHGDDEHRAPYLGEVISMLGMSKTVPDRNNEFGATLTTARDQLRLLQFLTSPNEEFLEQDRRSHVLQLMVTAASEYRYGTDFGAPSGTTQANKVGNVAMNDFDNLNPIEEKLMKLGFGYRVHSIGAIYGKDDNGNRYDYMMAILTDVNNFASGPIRINAVALPINKAMKQGPQRSLRPIQPTEPPTPTSGTVVPPVSGPAQTSAGPYQIRFEPTSKCVDNYKGSPTALNAIQQWTCARPGDLNFHNQRWYFDWEDGGSGYAKIRNVGTDMCLDVRDHSIEDGTPLVLQECSNSVTWKGFLKHDDDPDYYELRPRHTTGKCVDLPHSSTKDGVRLQLWDCVNINHQQHFTWG